MAAIGPRIMKASIASGLRPPSRSSRDPPKNIANRATNMIAAAIVAAIVLIRMSRCFTCASSCAMTPSSSLSREHPHDAFGRGDRRVLRIAAGRERVRRQVGNHVDLRHRQARLLRQPRRHPVERMIRPDLLRAVHPQDDLVGEPVAADVHHDRDDEAR